MPEDFSVQGEEKQMSHGPVQPITAAVAQADLSRKMTDEVDARHGMPQYYIVNSEKMMNERHWINSV
jgi:hypothetical protein